MAIGFGQKLFRLFLGFSLVPAAVLAAAGYYLVVHAGSSSFGYDNEGRNTVAEYYAGLLYSRLADDLSRYSADTLSAVSADFVLRAVDGVVELPRGADVVGPDAAAAILLAARSREQGYADAGGRIYQYRAVHMGDRLLVAGFAHGTQFRSLERAIQRDMAGRSGFRELQSRYTIFLGGLFLTLALATVLFASIRSRHLARSLAQPLAELSDAATSIADGDFRARVEPRGEQEVRNLIERFNQMAIQLESTTARLRATERVAAWRQVARRFAHELKNPLQPILVSLYRMERLLIDSDQYDKVYEPLKAASDEVRHLKQLAERFSHLAKLPPPALVETDLNELVGNLLTLYRDADAPYRVDAQLPEKPCVVAVDVAYLREALHNLIQNGLDATDRKGNVTVSVTEHPHRVDIAVADDGPGMNESTLASARLPYFTTKPQGHGLGLAIVEKSVAEMGGQLDIVSREGEGTTVTISLTKRS